MHSAENVLVTLRQLYKRPHNPFIYKSGTALVVLHQVEQSARAHALCQCVVAPEQCEDHESQHGTLLHKHGFFVHKHREGVQRMCTDRLNAFVVRLSN